MSIFKNENGVAVKKSGSSPNYNRNFAPVENSSTSSAAYSIGDLLIVGNRLVKAKTAIAIGDTFSLNQNIELTDVATEIGNGGSGSGGHTIENSSGTDLTQRDTLKFTGTLKATDDSTNKKTVISDAAEEVEWSVWNAMTEAERDAYSAGKKIDIVNVPGADGTISADLIDLLWTNPSSTSAFAAQTISLDLSEYDYVEIRFLYQVGSPRSTIVRNLVGAYGFIHDCSIPSTAAKGAYASERNFRITTTGVQFDGALYGYTGQSQTAADDRLVPYEIYGIKKTVSFKINAIASDVSTSANKCMMSDGETSVEDAITELGNYETLVDMGIDGQYTVTNLDSFKAISIVFNDGTTFFGVSTVSIPMFKTLFNSNTHCLRVLGMQNGSISQCAVQYVDNTHIAVQGGTGRYANVYGIK